MRGRDEKEVGSVGQKRSVSADLRSGASMTSHPTALSCWM
jgi:hypothetical protein